MEEPCTSHIVPNFPTLVNNVPYSVLSSCNYIFKKTAEAAPWMLFRSNFDIIRSLLVASLVKSLTIARGIQMAWTMPSSMPTIYPRVCIRKKDPISVEPDLHLEEPEEKDALMAAEREEDKEPTRNLQTWHSRP